MMDPARWMFIRALSILPALFHGGPAASTPPPTDFGAATVWRFEQVGVEDGLPHGIVYDVLQDRQGFLWAATQEGLARYDGHRVRTFRHDPDDPASLATNDLSKLLESRDGALWVATWGEGVARFDPSSETFTHIRPGPEGLHDGRVQALFETEDGILWAGTFAGGLSRIDPRSGDVRTWRQDPQDPSGLSGDRIWSIAEDSGSRALWLATERGLARLDLHRESFTTWRHDPANSAGLADDLVRVVHVDRGGALWVGSQLGLQRFDPLSGVFDRPGGQSELDALPVNTIAEDHKGRLWVGSDDHGLFLVDPARGPQHRLRHDPFDLASLAHNDVRAIFEDRGGVLWIGTRGNGLAKLDLKPRKLHPVRYRPGDPRSPSAAEVRSFAEDTEGRLWVGTVDGLDRWDTSTQEWTRFRADPADPTALPGGDIRHLHVDRAGYLWISVWRMGLSRFISDQDGFVHFRHDSEDPGSLPSDVVTALASDSQGNLWVGMEDGLARCAFERVIEQADPSCERWAGTAASAGAGDLDRPARAFARILAVDEEDALWVGTDSSGLFRLASGGEILLAHHRRDTGSAARLSNDRVLSLLPRGGGEVWVGTDHGLDHIRPDGTVRSYGEADGLPNATVNGLLLDAEGRLWIATIRVLSRLDPKTGEIHSFGAADGLHGLPLAGSSLALSDGRLVVGGIGGFTWLDPALVRDNPYAASIALVGLDRLGESLRWPVEEPIALPHNASSVTFELAALEFTHPAGNRFRYRLDSYDQGWVESTEPRAPYANLPPGDYVFRAKAANADGLWDHEELRVAVEVHPPWWGTSYARFLVALAALAFGVGLYRWRMRRHLRRERQLEHRIEAGLADLRRSEERYRQLVERNLAGVVRATAGGQIVDCNAAFANVYGFDSTEACRREQRLVLGRSSEEHAATLSELRAEGSLASREIVVADARGKSLALLWNITLAHDLDGEFLEGTVIDLGERRREEENLLQAQKLESLGVLAGGIAHDFNNLLMGILGSAELAGMELTAEHPARRWLGEVTKSGERAASLAKLMLAYSGKGSHASQILDLSETLEELEPLIAGAVAQRAQLVYELAVDLPAIRADAAQLRQVVMNLVTNAAEAVADAGGTITLATGVRRYRREELARTYVDDQLEEGLYVSFEVCDDGCGMDGETRKRIFDPFFTTKFTGRGLGLSAVLGIVRGHRGALEIDSEVGVGTALRALFPATEEEVSAIFEQSADFTWTGSGTVLLVDDEPTVRFLAGQMLEHLGFDVLSAADGDEGVEIFRAKAERITLVVLDLTMPRMGGDEAFAAMRKIDPSARVILMSGYDEQETLRQLGERGFCGFLQKPYGIEQLREKARAALGR